MTHANIIKSIIESETSYRGDVFPSLNSLNEVSVATSTGKFYVDKYEDFTNFNGMYVETREIHIQRDSEINLFTMIEEILNISTNMGGFYSGKTYQRFISSDDNNIVYNSDVGTTWVERTPTVANNLEIFSAGAGGGQRGICYLLFPKITPLPLSTLTLNFYVRDYAPHGASFDHDILIYGVKSETIEFDEYPSTLLTTANVNEESDFADASWKSVDVYTIFEEIDATSLSNLTFQIFFDDYASVVDFLYVKDYDLEPAYLEYTMDTDSLFYINFSLKEVNLDGNLFNAILEVETRWSI